MEHASVEFHCGFQDTEQFLFVKGCFQLQAEGRVE